MTRDRGGKAGRWLEADLSSTFVLTRFCRSSGSRTQMPDCRLHDIVRGVKISGPAQVVPSCTDGQRLSP